MSTPPTAGRADRLAELLRAQELDALVVTAPANVRYLTGFTGTNGVCLVGERLRSFLTDFRYVEQAERQVASDFERRRGRQDLLGDACEQLHAAGARRVGFEDHDLTVHRHARLRELAGEGVELTAAGQLVEGLRAVKDGGELAAIRAAAALAMEVLDELSERGFGGRSEREVAGELELAMRARGAEPSFPTIVAAGANGALPHATPSDDPIASETLVVVDLGCLLDGYCSDCTRTLASGPGICAGAREVYELVLAAQQRALTAVRPDAGCRALDAIARDAIADGGHGERFGHGLGHGVGLEVHEGPRLSQSADESERLSAGNVVTIEPGVYVPGEYGVRIEDLAIVADGGAEVLTRFPKTLITLDA